MVSCATHLYAACVWIDLLAFNVLSTWSHNLIHESNHALSTPGISHAHHDTSSFTLAPLASALAINPWACSLILFILGN